MPRVAYLPSDELEVDPARDGAVPGGLLEVILGLVDGQLEGPAVEALLSTTGAEEPLFPRLAELVDRCHTHEEAVPRVAVAGVAPLCRPVAVADEAHGNLLVVVVHEGDLDVTQSVAQDPGAKSDVEERRDEIEADHLILPAC